MSAQKAAGIKPGTSNSDPFAGLISRNEILQRLGVSKMFIYRSECRGELRPGIQMGHHKYYRIEDVELWINTKFAQARPMNPAASDA